MHVTAIGNLRPCEHQVAGHLFEEGKAGSLVDDRGHFYKPIQVGPRGDREREFYDAVAAALAEEEQQREELQARAAAAAAAAAQQQPLQNGRVGGAAAAGHAPRSSPKQILTARPSLASVRVPSFRERDASRGAVQIAQRDEFGLLGTPTLRDLRVGGSGDDWLGRSPDSEGAELTAEHLMDGFSLQHSNGHGAGAAGRTSSAQQQQQLGQPHAGQQQQARQQQLGQQQHMPKALSDPRHAEAAALLGQPAFDVELRLPDQAAHRAHHHYHHHYEPQPQAHACRRSSPLSKEGSKGQGQLAASPPTSPFQLGPAFEDEDADAAMHVADGEVLDAGAPSSLQQQQQHEQRGAAAAAGQHPAAELGISGGISEHEQQLAFSIPDRSFSAPAAAGSYDAHGLELRGLEMPEASAELAAEGEAGAGAGPGDSSTVAGPSSALSPRGGPRTWLGDSTSDSEGEGDSAAVGCSGGGGGGRGARRSVFPRLPFSVRNALLLEAIPKFYGVVEAEGRTFLELEDLTRNYRRPSIIDIKVGFRTWYPSASQAYIERCRLKDGSTTQAGLGFKICGMQVYRHGQGGYWRASKRWCKTLPAELVDKALLSFAHNEGGVRPEHVYGGPHGAIAQLQSLESWFELQREFHFYSSSVLILYEGGATAGEDARVRVRCVDFAHTFKLEEGRQQRDHNYLAGLRAIIARLAGVLRADATDSLA